VQQVAAAAIAELRRKRDAKPEDATPSAPKVDAEALRQREEAAQLKAQAERLLKAAEAKAKSSAEQALLDAEGIRAAAKEEGYRDGVTRGTEDGYEDGERKGEESGLAKYTETVTRMQALLESAQAEKEAYFTDREAMLVELAARIAAKVIAREVDTRPDHIQHLLRQAIRRLSDKAKLVVTLHPNDLEKVTQARADGLMNFQGVKQIEFLADDKMVPGGVRIQSGNQTLDAGLDSQLAEICRGLLEEAYHEA
jgi:flagellar assembly protein FliH